MRIGLIDVDGHNYPNLALMKIARAIEERPNCYHFTQFVSWYNPFEEFDIVCMSKVFSFTKDYPYPILNARKVFKGGTGYDLERKLPDYIDRKQPLYGIYPYIKPNQAYGFLTRGARINAGGVWFRKRKAASSHTWISRKSP